MTGKAVHLGIREARMLYMIREGNFAFSFHYMPQVFNNMKKRKLVEVDDEGMIKLTEKGQKMSQDVVQDPRTGCYHVKAS